jgi:phosphoglycerate dehydrogenase-like enzyme
MNVVVALGPVDTTVVQRALGESARLIVDPTADELATAAGAIVRANVTVDRAAFDSMPALRVLARTGVGTERVDLHAAHERNIPVVITPGSNTNAVAEGALAMALHLTKNLGQFTPLVREGRWNERDNFPVGDIDGAIVGVVGWGRIGRRFGDLVTALGATVRAFDPVATIDDSVRCDTLEQLLVESDIVSLHAPLVDSTRHIMNDTTIAQMKSGALLINCSRGPLLDLDAAKRGLESGHLGGIGLDVFDDEPATLHPIMNDPRVVLTPHVMGLSRRAAAQTFHDAAIGIRDVLEGRAPAAVAVAS